MGIQRAETETVVAFGDEVYDRQDHSLLDVSFMARKDVQSERVWVCLPVNYERLCTVSPADEEEARRFCLDEPDH